MLFNSLIFVFAFLPIAYLGYRLLVAFAPGRLAHVWLFLASLFFYGWWEPIYVLLLMASIVVNYFLGISVASGQRHWLLVVGISANIAALAYFKYAYFLAGQIAALTGENIALGQIILPLGISFFTFQQIAYLVDSHRGIATDRDPLTYCLFVTFFPHLIAGPVLHHREIMPQFVDVKRKNPWTEDLAIGLTIFVIGLFKKTVIGDGMEDYVVPVFQAAEQGRGVTLLEAWGGAVAYSFQIYFDFSGYSDMAVGLSRMFGVRLPVNFNSPYQAVSIIDFWRRWHITLSRLLRDYLYIPLGGNRRGVGRRYYNLMITMLLGGLWHGANWTFVLWGALHGLLLVLNHGWDALREKLNLPAIDARAARVITFIIVVLAWVPFRAPSLSGAMNMYAGLFGMNGIALPADYARVLGDLAEPLRGIGVVFSAEDIAFQGIDQVLILACVLGLVWLGPNTYSIMRSTKPVLEMDAIAPSRLRWSPTIVTGLVIAVLGVVAVASITRASKFIYFQF